MNSDKSEAIFTVVDAAGNVVGKATRGECHGGSMLLHPVVHLHVFNSRGELYLQKRPAWKDIQPGRWDTAVGGHVDYGETIAEALRREVREELGITCLLYTSGDRAEYDGELNEARVYSDKMCIRDRNRAASEVPFRWAATAAPSASYPCSPEPRSEGSGPDRPGKPRGWSDAGR